MLIAPFYIIKVNINKIQLMKQAEFWYINYWFLYKMTNKIHAGVIQHFEKLNEIKNKYKDDEFDKKIENAVKIIDVTIGEARIKVLPILKKETTQFEVSNIYDAACVIKNWWYFRDFNLFCNTHISQEIFTEWSMEMFSVNKDRLNELIESTARIDLDYVTFIY